MSHWDARAEALLARARASERVPSDAKARVKASVVASVALGAAAGASASVIAAPTAMAKLPVAVKAASSVLPVAAASAASSGSIAFLAPITVGVALGLSAVSPSEFVRPEPTVTTQTSRRAPVPTQASPQRAVQPLQAQKPTAEAGLPDAPATTGSAKMTSLAPSLGEEASLLEHARLVLRQGDAELALRLLDRQRREFPKGVLVFEALATRAAALCRMGKSSEGLQILARLESTMPASGLIGQVRASCATASGKDADPNPESKGSNP